MYRLSRLAMDEWKSDIKCQSITSVPRVAITHGVDARACSSTSRDLPHTIASEDTNKLCDAVSLSLGLNSESDNYDMGQPSTSHTFTENVQSEDKCAHASLELPETGKSPDSVKSSHFRYLREGRRLVVTNSPGLVETLQRNRDSPHFGMAALQFTATDMVSDSRQPYNASGPPQKRSPSMNELEATAPHFEDLLSTNTRLHVDDAWSRNCFTQNSVMFTTDLEDSTQPWKSARQNWDGAGKVASQPSRHCNVPSTNYSTYDLFLRNCNDYTLSGAPLSFSGYFPESYYSGGMYGRIPAPTSLPRPCEWTTGPNGLVPGFRLEDMLPMSFLLAAPRACQICGDVASGCHYGALTCGSCKVFFKRAAEGKQNFLCASRNDCTIDKLRRKNCPSCRLKRCFESGMTLRSRKLKVIDSQKPPERSDPNRPSRESTSASAAISLHSLQTLKGILERIEPLVVNAGHDQGQPDSAASLLTSLNQLGERQLVSVVKWAKGVPGFRNLHVDDQMMAIQYSWMVIMVFGLGWRSFTEADATQLFFAPDLIFDENRMHVSGMYEDCVRLRQLSLRFSGLRVSREEFLCMKALLLFSFIPAEGLKSQGCFDKLRTTYINELDRVVTDRDQGNRSERLFQLTQLLDYLQLQIVQKLHQFTYDLYVQTLRLQTTVNFPEMISEIISVHVPKILRGLVKPILFHK
ncbi:progesterone receptor-like isoform X1 [Alosa sapidissima]|uniref:progesterone receptor-like isoform X1 n=1 Tax=Alosa sapidissima TaxID=34773 RepID=UPI001C09B237|nr:progesterone receptor-like isoform X1 [Alosa sapidissima]